MLFSKRVGESYNFTTVKKKEKYQNTVTNISSLHEHRLDNTMNRISTLELREKRKLNITQNNLLKIRQQRFHFRIIY